MSQTTEILGNRADLYRELEEDRESRVLTYVTGDRRNLETKIHAEVVDLLTHHLDRIGDVPKISLVLYTVGGDTLAAWSLVNLVRQFCKELEVIVPAKAHSAGTLMCLGADAILMTKQARLGPIDPSVHTPLNPRIDGSSQRLPVSVEGVNGFIDYAKEALGPEANLEQVFLKLADEIHPLVLGTAYRARSQIRMLATKLINRVDAVSKDRIDDVLNFLCSDSGSHDYTIDRREAKQELGLPVQKPNDNQYELIWKFFCSIRDALDLLNPYEPRIYLGDSTEREYVFPRALIESPNGGAHVFQSKGTVRHIPPGAVMKLQQNGHLPPGVQPIQDLRREEGWVHVDTQIK